MKRNGAKYVLFLIFLIVPLPKGISQGSWSKQLHGIGTYSSPRISDLNNDGIGDIILGAGRVEFESCDTAIFALNGLNGDLLWNVTAYDQVFGSAALKDLNNDGIEDVVINGRSLIRTLSSKEKTRSGLTFITLSLYLIKMRMG